MPEGKQTASRPRKPGGTVVFGAIVFGAAIVAAVLGVIAAPPKGPPSYALASNEVWHAEVALALFATFYLAIMAVMLAWQGKAFTKLGGPAGISAEAAEVMRLQETGTELTDSVANLQASTINHEDRLTEIQSAVGDLGESLGKLLDLFDDPSSGGETLPLAMNEQEDGG